MQKAALPFIIFLLLGFYLRAQVSVDPIFPTQNDQITVYFDATQGNKALADCNCVVYAHAGVITTKSTSPTDWKNVQGTWGTNDAKVNMTTLGNNKYSLTYNIKEFYGLTDQDTVLKLAFVFRNVNGSIVGRSQEGSDIYYEIAQSSGFQYLVSRPQLTNQIVPLNKVFDLNIITSAEAKFQLFRNNILLKENNAIKEFNYSEILDKIGEQNYRLTIEYGSVKIDSSFVWIVPKMPEIKEVPAGTKLGFTEVNQNVGRILIDAPGKNAAYLIANINAFIPTESLQFYKSPNNRFIWMDFDLNTNQRELFYQIWFDDGVKIADPLSSQVLDPNNDTYIDEITYPNLPKIPKNAPSGLMSYINLDESYQWNDVEFKKSNSSNLVIYELLIRDFIAGHTYNNILDSIPYFKKLGINAIELMPVNEFEGNNSWGYNPSFHNAIDKYYGSPNDLKRFIDICHQNDIAVIADVVFNHAFSQSPLAQMYWDPVGSKPRSDNPWLNIDAKHPYNVGYDMNHESLNTKLYVKTVLSNYIEKYHFDGFRFDLSKGFTQNYSTDVSIWSRYDASRIAILKDYADAIWAIKPDTYVILEHFAENSEEIELTNYGMMTWGNATNAFGENAKGLSADLSSAYYKNRNMTKPGLITYMESHDEERMMYKNKTSGSILGAYSTRNEATALERMALAATFFYTIPGPKMLWQFEELGYDFSINTCTNGTINNNCRLDPKPIRWDYYQNTNRKNLYNIVSSLIHLKKLFPVFEDGIISMNTTSLLKTMILSDPNIKIVVLGNFDVKAASISETFPSNDWYFNYFSPNDSIKGSAVPNSFNFNAGEYKLYLNKKVTNPYPIDLKILKKEYDQIAIYPNPGDHSNELTLKISSLESNLEGKLEIQDMMGNTLFSTYKQSTMGIINLKVPQIPNGAYIFSFETKKSVYIGRWMSNSNK